MDGTPHRGFGVGEGAYDTFARNVDPLGDEVRSTGTGKVGAHTEVGGNGFSEVGAETGLAAAYQNRMRGLRDRISGLGGDWHGMAEAARATRVNYDAVEDEHGTLLRRLDTGEGR